MTEDGADLGIRSRRRPGRDVRLTRPLPASERAAVDHDRLVAPQDLGNRRERREVLGWSVRHSTGRPVRWRRSQPHQRAGPTPNGSQSGAIATGGRAGRQARPGDPRWPHRPGRGPGRPPAPRRRPARAGGDGPPGGPARGPEARPPTPAVAAERPQILRQDLGRVLAIAGVDGQGLHEDDLQVPVHRRRPAPGRSRGRLAEERVEGRREAEDVRPPLIPARDLLGGHEPGACRRTSVGSACSPGPIDCLASPKSSRTGTVRPSSSRLMMMFLGLMSRWTSPLRWTRWTASASSATTSASSGLRRHVGPDPVGDRAALDELHGEERAGLALPGPVDTGHVGVREPGGGLRLVLESAGEIRVLRQEVRVRQFDRLVPAQVEVDAPCRRWPSRPSRSAPAAHIPRSRGATPASRSCAAHRWRSTGRRRGSSPPPRAVRPRSTAAPGIAAGHRRRRRTRPGGSASTSPRRSGP